ncbi:MAG: twin-arginine translocase TatA/TatE family subunit [Solirubrobacteraceae bacterium]
MGLDNPLHIAFLLVILLLVFGAKRLPEMGRSLGAGLRGFKDTINGESSPAQVEQSPISTTSTEPTASPATESPRAQSVDERPRVEAVEDRPRAESADDRPRVRPVA